MRWVRIRWPLEERAQTRLLYASAVTENLADCEHDDGDHSDEVDGPCPDDPARGRRASRGDPGIWACGWMRSFDIGLAKLGQGRWPPREVRHRAIAASALCAASALSSRHWRAGRAVK